MMLKCKDCEHLFEESEIANWTEFIGERWGSPCFEEKTGCPICCGAYDEAVACKICGSYEGVEEDEEYCEECKEKVKKRFITFVYSNFTETERDLLNELYDGEKI